MVNQFFQQTKTGQKGKALASLIFGIIILILIVIQKIVLPWIGERTLMPCYFCAFIIEIIPFILLLLSIPGIITGIQGLKSAKRNLAIVGIVLNLIGLLVPLYYFLFY